MEQDFDVQRDHVELLTLAAQLLAPDGTIVFSNNYTRFRLDREGLAAFEIEDVGRRTLPKDFGRSPRIHACYVLRRRAAADRAAGITENSAGRAVLR
jgi:23S rRNA (guanine2445-N2)-methyltransferase / 23S rRNA (guanine2069-N7)-methyltransferase